MDYKGFVGLFVCLFVHLKGCYPVQFCILRLTKTQNMRAGYVPVKKLFNYHRFPGEVMLPEGMGSWAG